MRKSAEKTWRLIVRIATDTLGVLLILGAIFFGWLPGVGGIPLFLAGLGLLAINNHWAQRLLEFTRERGAEVYNTLFTDHPHLMWLYDILSVGIAATCVSFLIFHDSYMVRSIAFFFLTVAMLIFFANRGRLQKMYNLVKRKR